MAAFRALISSFRQGGLVDFAQRLVAASGEIVPAAVRRLKLNADVTGLAGRGCHRHFPEFWAGVSRTARPDPFAAAHPGPAHRPTSRRG